MKTIAFKPLISVEIIYSFDNKEQEMWSFDYFLEDVLMSEDRLVKDLRNKEENTNPDDVLNGNIDQFIEAGIMN